jgi:hypothetical protein
VRRPASLHQISGSSAWLGPSTAYAMEIVCLPDCHAATSLSCGTQRGAVIRPDARRKSREHGEPSAWGFSSASIRNPLTELRARAILSARIFQARRLQLVLRLLQASAGEEALAPRIMEYVGYEVEPALRHLGCLLWHADEGEGERAVRAESTRKRRTCGTLPSGRKRLCSEGCAR